MPRDWTEYAAANPNCLTPAQYEARQQSYDAREIFRPRTIEGEPVCCGAVTKCTDSKATESGTIVREWWCEECETTSTTETLLSDEPAPDTGVRDDDDENGDWWDSAEEERELGREALERALSPEVDRAA